MYRDPLPRELVLPVFNAIWSVIKSWDINVPSEYKGYCGASGNHVAAILDALKLAEDQNTSINNAMAKPCASCRYNGRTAYICKHCCPLCFSDYDEGIML